MENKFKVVSKYKPTGDQPQAIEKIAEGFQKCDHLISGL